MKKEYGATVVNDNGVFSIEIDDIKTSETVKFYDETFNSFQEADSFIENTVEKEFKIVNFHQKDLG